jgi:hypothetical protein
MFAYSCWTQDPEQLHEYEFLRNSAQLLDRLLLCVYYNTGWNIRQLLLCLLAVLPFPEQLCFFLTSH